MKYSLIIPAHNEAPVIAMTVGALCAEFQKVLGDNDWEIIVVDNASDDGTEEAVLRANLPGVRVIRLSWRGKGGALRLGFREAQGEVVGFTDADLPISPNEVVRGFMASYGDPDAVYIGSRYHRESKLPGREWWRTGSSRIFHAIAHMIIPTNVSDNQCPLKVMGHVGKEIFLRTKEDTWFLDLEFIAFLNSEHVPIHEIPVQWDEHRYPDRGSKLRPLDGVRAIVAMFRIRRRLRESKKIGYNGAMKWIIVGLGNPGGEYAKTRHNAGRIVLEVLRKKFDFPEWEYKKTYNALVSKGVIAEKEVLLLEPETFMNESGRSLSTLIKSKTDAEQLIVVHDDADLPIGSWRSARDRGAGGQKGVESIITVLKTRDFYRFRIGIAPEITPDSPRRPAGEYVLEKFTTDELATIKSRAIGVSERIAFLIENGHKAFKDSIKKIKPIDP